MSRSRKNKHPVNNSSAIQLKYEAVRDEVDGILVGGSFSRLTETLRSYANFIDNSRPMIQKEHRRYLHQQVERVLAYVKSEMTNLTANIETRYISNRDLWTNDYQKLSEQEVVINFFSSLNYGDKEVESDDILEGIKDLYKILDEHKQSVETAVSKTSQQLVAEQEIDKYSGIKRSVKTAATFTLITGLLAVGSYFVGRHGANQVPIEQTNYPTTSIQNGKNPHQNSQKPIIEKPSKETIKHLDEMLEQMKAYKRERELEIKQRELEREGKLKAFKKY